jgi:hypothetical protein
MKVTDMIGNEISTGDLLVVKPDHVIAQVVSVETGTPGSPARTTGPTPSNLEDRDVGRLGSPSQRASPGRHQGSEARYGKRTIMPCYDGREHDDLVRREQEFQRLTRVACDMAKFINRTVEHLSPETIAWIVEHERLDKSRSE